MKKAKLIREKKTRKAETTHLRNIIIIVIVFTHTRTCYYINIFTTKRKESTDNKNNKNNNNITLNYYSNATSVKFPRNSVVFFSKRKIVQLQQQKREQF